MTDISIPGKKYVGQEVYKDSIVEGLKTCEDRGYSVLFMPQLAQVRANSEGNARVWQTWWTTPSVRATGRTPQGSAVVVYSHIPSYLSNSENVQNSLCGLVNGAGEIPEKEFRKMVKQAENGKKGTFLVPYEAFQKANSGVHNIDDALAHPQTIPFLGGEENANQYLAKCQEVYGKRIGIWFVDDLKNEPSGRLLFLGGNADDTLNGSGNLNGGARFVGVPSGAEGTNAKKSH